MTSRIQPFLSAILFAGATLAAGSASLQAPPAHADESPPVQAGELPPPTAATEAPDPAAADGSAGGVSGNLYFTDEHGNPRNPTAAELITAGKAFEKDLKRLAGNHYGKPNLRTEPSGATAATVATSQMVLLTAVRNEDGTVTISHSALDENGDMPAPPALPEK